MLRGGGGVGGGCDMCSLLRGWWCGRCTHHIAIQGFCILLLCQLPYPFLQVCLDEAQMVESTHATVSGWGCVGCGLARGVPCTRRQR